MSVVAEYQDAHVRTQRLAGHPYVNSTGLPATEIHCARCPHDFV